MARRTKYFKKLFVVIGKYRRVAIPYTAVGGDAYADKKDDL